MTPDASIHVSTSLEIEHWSFATFVTFAEFVIRDEPFVSFATFAAFVIRHSHHSQHSWYV